MDGLMVNLCAQMKSHSHALLNYWPLIARHASYKVGQKSTSNISSQWYCSIVVIVRE